MNTEQTTGQKIEAFAAQHKLTLHSEFVPFSRSRNKHEKSPSLNWRITLRRDGRDVLSTDYGAGCGHCPGYNKKPPTIWDRPAKYWKDSVARWECENGFEATFTTYGGFSRSNIPAKRNHLQPALPDVLHSLCLDSDVLDAGTFEEWASNFGYDTDSRKAEAIYRACLEIALKLRNGLGEDVLRQLCEVCQDY